MTAIILAGGKSTRMGFDKAFIKIDGVTLVCRQLSILQKIFREIIIVTNNKDAYSVEGVKIIEDAIPAKGPLGGIYSGLTESRSDYNFVVACDMPFINVGLIRYMRLEAQGYDVAVPKFSGRYEPLFCIYSKECLTYIKLLLDKEDLKIRSLFYLVKVREISEREVSRFGNPNRIFTNVNNREDLMIVNS